MTRNRALLIGLLIGGVLALSTWGITQLIRHGNLPFLSTRVEVVPPTPTPFAPPGAPLITDPPTTATPTPTAVPDPFSGAAQVLLDIIPSP